MQKRFFTAFTIAVFVIFFIVNVFLLSHYGMNWDSNQHFGRGQAFLRYFISGKVNYDDLDKVRQHYSPESLPSGQLVDVSLHTRSLFQNDSQDLTVWEKHWDYIGHPPFAGLAASFLNYVFYQKLGLLGDVESYHLLMVLLGSLVLAIVYKMTTRQFDRMTGIFAVISLATYPLFFGELHFNLKDPTTTALFTITIYFLYKGVIQNNIWFILISTIASGMAMATKFNVLSIIFICIPWFIFWGRNKFKVFKWPLNLRLSIAFLIYPLVMIGIFFIVWPNVLPASKFEILTKTIEYYRNIGTGTVYQADKYLTILRLNTYPIQWILYITPLVTLTFFLFGCIYSVKQIFKDKNGFYFLILCWFWVTVIRVSLPGASIYGGIRQIMEYIPAMSILAAVGFYAVRSYLSNLGLLKRLYPPKRNIAVGVALFLLFIPIIIRLVMLHPNENEYFNPLIGGLNGARDAQLQDWGNSYGNSYRQAVNWLNQNAETSSKVTLAFSYASVIPRIWFRDDLQYSNSFRSGILRKGEYIIERTEDWPSWTEGYYSLDYTRNFLNPVYQLKVDGVSIVTIWKNDLAHTKPEYRVFPGPVEINSDKIKMGNSQIIIELDKSIKLSDAKIEFKDSDCSFSKDDVMETSVNNSYWIEQKKDLQGPLFGYQDDFGPEKIYFFDGRDAKFIMVKLATERKCLGLNKVTINKLGSR